MSRPKTVDDVVGFIEANATEGRKFPLSHFNYVIVDGAISELHAAGKFLDLEAFDIRGTNKMWNTENGSNFELARKGTKKLIQKIQKETGKRLEELLPQITSVHFIKTPINMHKTTLSGMIQHIYESSPYDALKDLIDSDPEFEKFRDFEPYDMQMCPLETWQGEEGRKLAIKTTKILIKKLQEENPGKKLEEILPAITQDMFYKKPINRYGTTLGGMTAFNRSPYEALKALIDSDDEFKEFRDFEPYDMQASHPIWQGEEGRKLARKATKTLVKKLQEENPGKKLEEILPTITARMLLNKPINKYGTTIYGMMIQAYDDSPYSALKDLIENDSEFEEYRDLQPYDMETSPQGTWDGEEGKKRGRQLTKALIKKVQKENPGKKLEEILPAITAKTFLNTTVNRYNITAGKSLHGVYGLSPYDALKDLIDNDPEFKQYRDLQPYDMSQAPLGTWKREESKELARQSTKTLIKKLQANNPKKPIEEILTEATQETFKQCPINKYGTTMGGMLGIVYDGSPYRALKDLAENDDELRPMLPIIEELRHKVA